MRASRLTILAGLALLAPLASAQMTYDTYAGAWRGPVQFHTSVAGQRDPASHQIAQGVIEIAPDGQVRGIVNDAGCRVSGLGREFVTAGQASLDVTLKGCADPRRNQRYSGYLIVNAGTKAASLILNHVGGLRPSTQVTGQFKR